jgi:hypothetical protein
MNREFLAEESPNSHEFFGWIDLFSSVGLWNPGLSQEEALGVVTSSIFCETRGTCDNESKKNRLPSHLLPLLELSLSTRYYAPRIQAYYQFYETLKDGTFDASCGVWADYQGRQYCDLNALKESLNSTNSVEQRV